MKRLTLVTILLLLVAAALQACTKQQQAQPQAATSGTPQPASTATTTPTAAAAAVSFDDLTGVAGQQQIVQLAQLGVFGTTSGHFNPAQPIARGEFIKWLVLANNAVWSNDPDKQIRTASTGEAPAYPDVPATHADYPYIQGMYDAGFAIGFNDKYFHPDADLTHEQMIAIKESVDRGGIDKYYVEFWDSTMPNWKDRTQIAKPFVGAIAEDSGFDRKNPDNAVGNIGRAFGAIAMFRPKTSVTRAQAALVLWKIGPHNDSWQEKGKARSAADALAPQASPSPTP